MRHQSQTSVVERASLLQTLISISFDVPYLEIVAIRVAIKTVTSSLALRPACGRGLPHFHCRRWLGFFLGAKVFIPTRICVPYSNRYLPLPLLAMEFCRTWKCGRATVLPKAPTAICTIAKPFVSQPLELRVGTRWSQMGRAIYLQ